MPTNDFLPFGTAVGANVMTQTDYLALTARSNGFSAGTAASAQLNKAWRQASIIASTLAQFIVDQSGQSAVDDGTTTTLEANLLTAIRAAGRQATILTDTGTANTYTAANTPALTSLPPTGYSQQVNIANANTGASTYAPDGLTAKPIYGLALQPLQGGELPAGIAVLMYLVQAGVNGGNGAWILIESLGGASQVTSATKSQHAVNAGQIQAGTLAFAIDTGTTNTYVCAFTPAITARAEGQVLRFKVKTANTGPSTLNDGLGAVNLVGGAHVLLQGGELIANGDAWAQWNSTVGYVLLFCTGAAEQVAPATKSLHAVQFGQVSGVAGQASNLKASITSAQATATFTADEIIVETALGGLRYCLSNFNLSINLATTGAGGMDTGSAPLNGFVAIYAIYNPVTTATALLAVNASSATPTIYGGLNMPAGYTASARIGVLPTNGSGQFKVFSQVGRSISIASVQVFSGSSGGLVLLPIPLSSAVPLDAISATGSLTASSTSSSNCGLTLSSTSASLGSQSLSGAVAAGGGIGSNYLIDIDVPQTAYVSTTNTAGAPTYTASIVRYSI